MVQRWPGVFIASVPEKKAVGNMTASFVEQRRAALNSFVNKLAQVPALFYSDEVREFLRDSQENFPASLNRLPKQSHGDIISKYQMAFPHLAGKEINT